MGCLLHRVHRLVIIHIRLLVLRKLVQGCHRPLKVAKVVVRPAVGFLGPIELGQRDSLDDIGGVGKEGGGPSDLGASLGVVDDQLVLFAQA